MQQKQVVIVAAVRERQLFFRARQSGRFLQIYPSVRFVAVPSIWLAPRLKNSPGLAAAPAMAESRGGL